MKGYITPPLPVLSSISCPKGKPKKCPKVLLWHQEASFTALSQGRSVDIKITNTNKRTWGGFDWENWQSHPRNKEITSTLCSLVWQLHTWTLCSDNLPFVKAVKGQSTWSSISKPKCVFPVHMVNVTKVPKMHCGYCSVDLKYIPAKAWFCSWLDILPYSLHRLLLRILGSQSDAICVAEHMRSAVSGAFVSPGTDQWKEP